MAEPHSDIVRGGWLESGLPRRLRPFARLARLDRPIGWWLLLLPCWWSLALAGGGETAPWLFVLFWLGAVVMRGAGCTLNDILDRKIDAQVERTRTRPLPAGEVTVWAALLFLVLQLFAGAAVLFSLNRLSIGLGFFVLLLVATYPLMKRVTFWPQFFLGLNFNWGALMGWSAATGSLGAAPVALYLAGIAWTLGYDTIYAFQDARDDAAAGVKSTALRFGRHGRAWVGGFYGATILLFGTALALCAARPAAWLVLAAAAGHFIWQIATWRPEHPADCAAKFRSNRDAGLILTVVALLADR